MKKAIDTIILSALWIFSIYTLFFVVFKSGSIGIQNYIGFGLLVVISLLKFLKVRGFKTILALFLIAGSFNLFQFTSDTVTSFFTFSPWGYDFFTLGIQPLCSSLLVLYAIVCIAEIKGFLTHQLEGDSNRMEEADEELVQLFYKRLIAKTDKELSWIIHQEDQYQTEFVIAAHRLFNDRKMEDRVPSRGLKKQEAAVQV